jgi:hypothetical protein|tara:strand:+ start:1815 stop:2366 length:552 start_codon:yes stop_codon:yes gene_type:complete
MKKPQKRNHYVDNKELLAAMIVYRDSVIVSKSTDQERPRVPNYIGECIMKIAQHLSYKPNFINYTYKEEMISDGIENCLLYIDNFNPEKSSNPFAYFTQIIYYAFIRRIQKEKKQTYVKYKSLENQELIDEIMQGPNGTPVKNNFMEFIQSNMDDFLSDFEENQRKKKEKAKEKRDSKETETP